MLLPLQGANPNVHIPRALPWARCLLAFQAVTSQKLYRTPITHYIHLRKDYYLLPTPYYLLPKFPSIKPQRGCADWHTLFMLML